MQSDLLLLSLARELVGDMNYISPLHEFASKARAVINYWLLASLESRLFAGNHEYRASRARILFIISFILYMYYLLYISFFILYLYIIFFFANTSHCHVTARVIGESLLRVEQKSNDVKIVLVR